METPARPIRSLKSEQAAATIAVLRCAAHSGREARQLWPDAFKVHRSSESRRCGSAVHAQGIQSEPPLFRQQLAPAESLLHGRKAIAGSERESHTDDNDGPLHILSVP